MAVADSVEAPPVAIVGAGLAGLCMGLALHHVGIPCEIYDSRGEDDNYGGGLVLSPNGIQVLKFLGLWEKLEPLGYTFDYISFVNEHNEPIDRYYYGEDEIYGSHALRILRRYLVDIMKEALAERNVKIYWHNRFVQVTSESEKGVTFELGNGECRTASILIGCDGIYSHVRSYIEPVKPKYSGLLSLYSDINTKSLRFPPDRPDFPMPATVQSHAGGCFILPQTADGSESIFGFQVAYPELDREGWKALDADKRRLSALLTPRKGTAWPEIIQSALDNTTPDRWSIWPFYATPRLDSWSSPQGRVIIIGDAAHAIPPSSGQGVNQAYEDVYTLSALLARLQGKDAATLAPALALWHGWRQKRIDGVMNLVSHMNYKRLPEVDRKKFDAMRNKPPVDLAKEAIEGRMAWLFMPKLDENVGSWVAQAVAAHRANGEPLLEI